MHILQVIPTYLPAIRYGGTIFTVHGLAKALVAEGHTVHVYTTNVDGASVADVPVGKIVERDGVRITYFESHYGRRFYYSPQMERALDVNLKDFDVVHLHSVFLWPTYAAARIARAKGVPYVLSPHGMLVRDLLAAHGWLRKSLWIKAFERANLAGASRIHVTSVLEQHDLEALGLALAPTTIIPFGVDMPVSYEGHKLSADVATLIHKGIDVLSFGRISWKKGLDRLIKAAKHLNGVHIAIAGNDDENYTPKLQRLAHELGVGAQISFLPRQISGADKEALLGAARLFVLPSLSENFGNVVLEAMIRKCPVLLTEGVGTADLVRASGGGIVTTGKPEAIADLIELILNDTELRNAMGAKGHQEVSKNFGWSAIARDIAKLYADAQASHVSSGKFG